MSALASHAMPKRSLTFPPIFIATFEYRNNVLVCHVRLARIFDGNGQRRKTVKHGNLGGRFRKDGGSRLLGSELRIWDAMVSKKKNEWDKLAGGG